MQETRRIIKCDKCGGDIPNDILPAFAVVKFLDMNFDLCDNCYNRYMDDKRAWEFGYIMSFDSPSGRKVEE